MVRLRRHLPSPAMGVAFLALVVALGGTSYAVVRLPANSVGSKHLKSGAVQNGDVKSNAITSSKVRDGSLTGRDLDMASLGAVARATLADRATVADRATSVDKTVGIDRLFYRLATVTVPPAPDAFNSSSGVATARCDPGHLVLGGGVRLDDNMSIVDGYPESAAGWTANVNNDDTTAARTATVYAICVPASSPG
jgi:hypothetical protein